MLLTQFIGLNLYFAVNLVAALVCFAVFWLIFDAWTIHRPRKELLKWVGFLALFVGFLLNGAGLYRGAGDPSGFLVGLASLIRLIGYAVIAAGQLIDPLEKRPNYEHPPITAVTGELAHKSPAGHNVAAQAKPKKSKKTKSAAAFVIGPIAGLVLPLAAGSISYLYWRRSHKGLERHLAPVTYAFAGLATYELLNDLLGLSSTTSPIVYQLVAPFGIIWWLALIALSVSAFILGRWVWNYLTERLQSQLFIILLSQAVGLFLVSTIGFTYLLFQNIHTQSLADLSTASRVLQYATNARQGEVSAQAEAVAASSAVSGDVATTNHVALSSVMSGYLDAHSLSTLTITSVTGQVLYRGDDPSRWGDSLSGDPLVRRGLVGETSSGAEVTSGVLAPTVLLLSEQPIRDGSGNIVGTVTAGRTADTAFVDGLSSSTGLDIAVYGGNVISSTTLLAQDGMSRAIGVKMTDVNVTRQVLQEGNSYSTDLSFNNRSYLASFSPLKDSTGDSVGMLMAARPADALFSAANRSIQLTFIIVVLLILLSIFPILLITRYLAAQLK